MDGWMVGNDGHQLSIVEPSGPTKKLAGEKKLGDLQCFHGVAQARRGSHALAGHLQEPLSRRLPLAWRRAAPRNTDGLLNHIETLSLLWQGVGAIRSMLLAH